LGGSRCKPGFNKAGRSCIKRNGDMAAMKPIPKVKRTFRIMLRPEIMDSSLLWRFQFEKVYKYFLPCFSVFPQDEHTDFYGLQPD